MNLRSTKAAWGVLYGLCIVIYFLRLSGVAGIHTGFSHDDLMNMYRAWVEPLPRLLAANFCFFLFPSSFRPFGGLFYHLFYSAFGLNPLPFRICILLFLLANIYLTYAFVRRITASREIGVVAALLHCFHIGFMPLYRNTGTCYDVFCFFFYISAFLYYLRIRQRGRFLRPLEQLAFLSLLVLALNSKEIAVTLPVMIGLYELLYYPPSQYRLPALISWLAVNGRLLCWGMVIDLMFLLGKVYGAHGIASEGGYFTVLRLHSYILSVQHDLNEVFFTYGTNALLERKLILLLLVALLIAWRSKSASFRFSLLFWLLGILPVAFIQPRGMYAIYIPLLGFASCMAIILVKARDLLNSLIGTTPPVLAFLLLLFAMAWYFRAKGAYNPTGMDIQANQITSVSNQLRAALPSVRKGARMLFLKDPFEGVPNVVWATVFIARMLYRDSTLVPDRLAMLPQKPDAAALQSYDYIFTVEQGRLVLVPRSFYDLPPTERIQPKISARSPA